MADRRRPNFKPWGEEGNPGKDVASAAWTGAKTAVVVTVAAVALGLGLGAMDAAAG